MKEFNEANYNNYKSFNELIERLESVKDAIKKHNYGIAMDILSNPYPGFQITTSTELKESEDKQIMKEIAEFIYNSAFKPKDIKKKEKWLTWFEKQESVEEIVERCKTSWYNEGKIQGQIEGLSDEEKYQQGWYDALEKQGKLVEEYEDKLDRCACESFNKGYKAAIEHQKEKQGEWSKEDMDIINGIIMDYEGEIEHLSDSAINEQAKPIYQERIKNFLNRLKSLYLVKQEWSEEDEQYLLVCKNALVKYQTTDKWDANIISRWLEDKLKSLKDRVQPNPSWGEEDDIMLRDILRCLPAKSRPEYNQRRADWLKSLKERIGRV